MNVVSSYQGKCFLFVSILSSKEIASHRCPSKFAVVSQPTHCLISNDDSVLIALLTFSII
jgi:hypothetical protein